jgi:hypothetical protein
VNNEVFKHLCDFSKAFDKIRHERAIHKLKKAGISRRLLRWLEDYLSNRKQKVVINGECSPLLYLEIGVQQGFILSSLIFILYINDLAKMVNIGIRIYADDTTLFIIYNDPLRAR